MSYSGCYVSLASGRVHPPFENGVLSRGWSQVSSCLNTLLSGTNGWDPLFIVGIYLCSISYVSNQYMLKMTHMFCNL